MSQKATDEEELEFKWGKMKATGLKGEAYYESFTYDGTEYFLYDCIYLWRTSQPEPDIGKVIKIFKTQNLVKKVRVVWFFRPSEVHTYLESDEPLENELFLASGEGTGLTNVNPLLAIAGKCNVICTSKDRRNPRASQAELRTSDFIYNRTFDIGSCALSDSFPDKIANTKVEYFFNRKKDQWLISSPESKSYMKERVKDPTLVSQLGLDRPVGTAGRDRNFSNTVNSEVWPFKKRKFSDTPDVSSTRSQSYTSPSKPANAGSARILGSTGVSSASNRLKFSGIHPRSASCVGEAKSKLVPTPTKEFSNGSNLLKKINNVPAILSSQIPEDRSVKMHAESIEVMRRPNLESSRWFKQKPWEERMWKAHQQHTLVLLENLPPSCSASEVQDIVWRAVNHKVDARVIESCAFSSQPSGRAFVIFESKVAADSAITELSRRCLMLPNQSGSPLVAHRECPIDPEQAIKFSGHLVLNKMKFQSKREEMRTAVSTSHCSRPNNAEYEMALEWKKLQEKSDIWWNDLHKKQSAEVEELQRQFRNTYK